MLFVRNKIIILLIAEKCHMTDYRYLWYNYINSIDASHTITPVLMKFCEYHVLYVSHQNSTKI